MIREAEPADAAEIAVLLADLGYPTITEAVGERMTALLGRADHRLVVAETDGVLAGVLAVHVFPTIHGDAPAALITALVVRASLHGRGIGRLLVADAERYAKERGCVRIVVGTANHREGAHRFYESLRYDFTGRRYARPI